MKVGVISDVHANEGALDGALARLVAEHVDHIVILGDLLSYGCRPRAVVERLLSEARSRPMTFLVGNHDQLYFELQTGDETYFRKLPAWIRESARWTVSELGALRLAEAFPWQQEWVSDGTLFAHANPFAPGDWTYLNGGAARDRAARALARRGFHAGVFGHTHRPFEEQRYAVRLLNPGSVGQSREACGRATVAVWSNGDWNVLAIDYDEAAHCDAVARSSLSAATRREILKYHAIDAASGGVG